MFHDFFIVAIGSSAGGLPPTKEILSVIPGKANVAFVIVPHLSATHKSNLDTILLKYTNIPIVRVSHHLRIQKGIIYLLPEGKMMTIKNGLFIVRKRQANEIANKAINIFFSSLANDAMTKAIGVVLSGCGVDGLQGLRQISINKGLIIVQDPETAEFPDMPTYIIKQIRPDYILSPEEIGRKILALVDFPLVNYRSKDS